MSIHTWFNLNCSSTVGVWHWVDYTQVTQVRRRLRVSGQRELIEAYLKWNIDNLSDSSCSTIIPGSEEQIMTKQMPHMKPQTHREKELQQRNRFKTVSSETIIGHKHYDNTPIQIGIENFTIRKGKISDKKFLYFSDFCWKYSITKTRLFKYIESFTSKILKIFR